MFGEGFGRVPRDRYGIESGIEVYRHLRIGLPVGVCGQEPGDVCFVYLLVMGQFGSLARPSFQTTV